MSLFPCSVLTICVVCSACGGSSPASPAAIDRPSPTRPPVQLKVMTFNIQHGVDGNGKYTLQNAITTIARLQPDVVGLQEVTRNHPSYACDDQPAKIAAGVQAATGQNWSVVYQQEWFTPDVSCQQSGRGDGRETEGLVMLTRRSMTTSTMMPLPDSRIGMQASLADVYGLPIVVTHLSSGASSGTTRTQQIDRLLGWAAGFGPPRIVMGDLNAPPTAPELQSLFGSYRDAWIEALQSGHANGDGNSHGSSRIDYIFYTAGGAMTVDAAQVIDTAPLLGVQVSDHRPVLATFTIR